MNEWKTTHSSEGFCSLDSALVILKNNVRQQCFVWKHACVRAFMLWATQWALLWTRAASALVCKCAIMLLAHTWGRGSLIRCQLTAKLLTQKCCWPYFNSQQKQTSDLSLPVHTQIIFGCFIYVVFDFPTYLHLLLVLSSNYSFFQEVPPSTSFCCKPRLKIKTSKWSEM